MDYLNGKRLLATGFIAGLTAGLMSLGFSGIADRSAAAAEDFQMLKTVTIDLQPHSDGITVPEKLQTVEEVVKILEESRNIAVQMEVVRRAYHDLPLDAHEKFVQAMAKRHKEIPDDTYRAFAHGYTELMFRTNKTGLYFLRKADDALKNQFTSLAYAMAQAEVDINDEMARPDDLTRRKQDVTYRLQDAVQRDAQTHLPGFWPAFVAVIDKLKPMLAYQDFIDTDFTMVYVPYGQQVLPNTGLGIEEDSIEMEESSEPADKLPGKEGGAAAAAIEAVPVVCNLTDDTSGINFGNLYRSISVDLNDDGTPDALHFLYTDQENLYRVVAINSENQILADLTSPVAPYIMEDLDNDGTPELVVRKFKEDMAHPVEVYRFDNCVFKQDETVSAYFK